MTSIVFYVALGLFAVFFYFYSKLSKRLSYFKDRGIPQLETEFFYGSARELIEKKTFQGEFYRNAYNKFKNMGLKHGGLFLTSQPVWVPIDPELIKTILVKDFSYFAAHFGSLPKALIFQTLFAMQGEEWKDMRKKLTPTFTSGKMKMMYNILLEKTNGLSNLVEEICKTGEATEIKPLVARFTTDVIASCGFGIECNSLKDKNSEFYRQGQNIFKDIGQNIPLLIKNIIIYLGIKPFIPSLNFKEIEIFFRNVVRNTIDYREKNKIIRKDFMHLMIQLKNKGIITELTNENEDIYNKTVTEEVMSLDGIVSQCLLFFTAGFETSATTMSFALLELTQYPEIQKKLTEEVREVLKKHNGIMTYDALQEMTYHDNVIHETLRKYPPVPTLPRLCTKNYTIPGTNIVIEKDTTVNIPVWGLHMDPDYFPDPEKFIPERFNAENKSKIKDFTYMPFGEGPRMCLGLRFGIMQSKAGLATLMKDYNFTLDKKTPYPVKYLKTGRLINAVEGGVWLKAQKVV